MFYVTTSKASSNFFVENHITFPNMHFNSNLRSKPQTAMQLTVESELWEDLLNRQKLAGNGTERQVTIVFRGPHVRRPSGARREEQEDFEESDL